MSQTILVAPLPGSHLFFRADFASGRWFPHPNAGPFHAILPGLLQIMGGDGGPNLVISTHRGEELMARAPDDFDLSERATTEIWCPLGDLGSPSIWATITFHDPNRDPVAGERFVAKQLVQTLREAFPSDTNAKSKFLSLDELKRPDLVARRELWIRRDWVASEIAPGAFQTIKLDLGADAAALDQARQEAEADKARRARVGKASRSSAEAGEHNAKSGKQYAAEQAKRRAATTK